MDISAFPPQHRLDRNVKTERIEITSKETGEERVIFKIPDEEMKKSFIDWNNPRNDEMRHSTITRQSHFLLGVQAMEQEGRKGYDMQVEHEQRMIEMEKEKLRSLPSMMSEERKQWQETLDASYRSISSAIDNKDKLIRGSSETQRICRSMIDNLSRYDQKPNMGVDQTV